MISTEFSFQHGCPGTPRRQRSFAPAPDDTDKSKPKDVPLPVRTTTTTTTASFIMKKRPRRGSTLDKAFDMETRKSQSTGCNDRKIVLLWRFATLY